MARASVWATRADRVLSRLFLRGHAPPSRRMLIEAYPFGERKRWPYKVWCWRVRLWKLRHATGLVTIEPRRSGPRRDPAQLPLFHAEDS